MKKALYNCEGFEWDEGNSDKNWYLHQVTAGECEQVFFNLPLIVASDTKYSQQEPRIFVLGRTDADRWLFIAFVIRENRIRVISARDMNDQEARKYAERVKGYTDLQE
ncbi:BrnT family toxin [Chloroflexota bacterium]